MKYQLAGIQHLDARQDSMYELADLQVDRHVPVFCRRMIQSHGCFFKFIGIVESLEFLLSNSQKFEAFIDCLPTGDRR